MANYQDIYLSKLLNVKSSGIIKMTVPTIGEDNKITQNNFEALLEDNIRIKTENKWGTLVPSLDSLSQVSQLLDSTNIVSWINGSSAAWESTQPIDVAFQIRLITLSSKHDILKQMVLLQSLTALRVNGALTVNAHGGYRNNFWTNNEDIGQWYDKDRVKKELTSSLGSDLAPYGEDGTVSITFGNLTIANLLVNNINTQVSKVLCRNLQPLWIKIDVSLRGVRALLIRDLQQMVPDSGLDASAGLDVDVHPEDPKPLIDPEVAKTVAKKTGKLVDNILGSPANLVNPVMAPLSGAYMLMKPAVTEYVFGANTTDNKNSNGGGW